MGDGGDPDGSRPLLAGAQGLMSTNMHKAHDHETRGKPLSEGAVIELLRRARLRPTRQRLALGTMLFTDHGRHVTAEILHAEAVAGGERVSLATVYNTLHQFKRAGLVRELAIDGTRTYFETNTSNHSHFYVEQDGRLMDIPEGSIRVDGLPTPPKGMRISHVDVVVRLVEDDRG
jgi:Fur family iron response transcriptional regulator